MKTHEEKVAAAQERLHKVVKSIAVCDSTCKKHYIEGVV
jgi:hypothetical protein